MKQTSARFTFRRARARFFEAKKSKQMFTRGDPNAPDDRGPSMMVRHAEIRAREAARAADAHLRQRFPAATSATLALALESHGGDVELAKDALREFFAVDRGATGAGSRRGRGSDGSDADRRRRRKEKRSERGHKERRHKKSRRRSRSRDGRGREDRADDKDGEDDDGRGGKRRTTVAFGNDEEMRRREIAEAREREAAARQSELVERMRARGDAGAMREQDLLRHKLQVAHRTGDAREVERIQKLLAPDDALQRAAADNYGFAPS